MQNTTGKYQQHIWFHTLPPDSPPIGKQQQQGQRGHSLENGPIAAHDSDAWQQQLRAHSEEAADHGSHETMGRVTQLQPWDSDGSRGRTHRLHQTRTDAEQIRLCGADPFPATTLVSSHIRSLTVVVDRVVLTSCHHRSFVWLQTLIKALVSHIVNLKRVLSSLYESQICESDICTH